LPSTIKIRRRIDPAPDGGTYTIMGDPTQVQQVIMNLCTNASHAMKGKGGILDVSLSRTDFRSHDVARPKQLDIGSYVRLTVSDTGSGMTPELRERIFEPFFTTKEMGEGTGLGLSVVHGIVQSYGGAVSVYKRTRQGHFIPGLYSKPGNGDDTAHRS